MCVRAANEEYYANQVRYALIAGTFDKYEQDVTELPNIADVTYMRIELNGEVLDLNKGKHSDYRRTLNLKTGLHTRSFVWTAENGASARFEFQRIVSLDDLHLIASEASVTPLNDFHIEIRTGVQLKDRHGAPHFKPTSASVTDKYIT